MKNCKTCDYFKPIPGTNPPMGQCRRYPPKIVPLNSWFTYLWPEVQDTNGCGEHKEPPTPAKSRA